MNHDVRNIIKQILNESDVPKILNVPHYLQSDDSTCGPASLRMVMAYYGLEMSEEDIAGACGHSYELGCRSEDMGCAAQALGFDVLLKNNSTIEELVRLVKSGVPVIVDWFCGDPPEGHSSVVVGASENDLYILDPYLEEMRVVSKYDFRRCWFDFYETPITPDNLYVGQIMVLRPRKNFKSEPKGNNEVQEIELKERCWSGYTQKGMKTMFGKRYPNCVKKKINEDIKEYFDPIHYLKNKTKGKPKYFKDSQWESYEEEFQKLVDFVFRKTKKMYNIEHLNGLEVTKVTPQSDSWVVLLRPVVDDWFNWVDNRKFQNNLEVFNTKFKDFIRMGGIDSPHQEEGFPRDIEFIFSRA